MRQRFAERGLLPALRRKEQEKRKERLLDGEGEAHLITLTCSAPPEGHKRWDLHLLRDALILKDALILRDALIEQQIVDAIGKETVRQTLKNQLTPIKP